jgi:hypothetical protein
MDAHSVNVENDGEIVRVDVPMRSFQGGAQLAQTYMYSRG